jgi:RNA polymerase sigma factor (sigma-70 family)
MDALSMDSDQRLIARTLEGELTAFEQLVQRHRNVVFRVAARIVGPDDAEDVSQDAFLRAYRRLDRFKGAASFRSWLLQIAQNAALDTPGPQTTPSCRSAAGARGFVCRRRSTPSTRV